MELAEYKSQSECVLNSASERGLSLDHDDIVDLEVWERKSDFAD
jgi:hypothetical protein